MDVGFLNLADLIAPFDNDSAVNPVLDEFLSIGNANVRGVDRPSHAAESWARAEGLGP
jgi:hypothetical protein